MIGYVFVLAAWIILMIVLGIYINSKLDESYIEHLEKSREFHKDQKERFADDARGIVKENNHLKERNSQLINENKRLKKELDNQGHVTYNYYINKLEETK
uniref:DAZ-interacting protein-like protein n=1 Tax=Siphoviridae sp. ctu8P6 TaxID=2827282 RepID=A0A8S5R4F4_9CAUD|nr:MAG TPA: DAZ-interacting protein-like protein [Siphoviridae sp. ctu8P6]